MIERERENQKWRNGEVIEREREIGNKKYYTKFTTMIQTLNKNIHSRDGKC